MLDRTLTAADGTRLLTGSPQNGLAAPQGAPPGVILRAMILDGVITARAALKGKPDREAIAAARRDLREARWCFKVFRKAMGPAYPARAARLQAASRAMKHLARILAADVAPDPAALAELLAAADALLRRCEGDAVSLAPFQADEARCKTYLRKLRRKASDETKMQDANLLQASEAEARWQRRQAQIALIQHVLAWAGLLPEAEAVATAEEVQGP
ncbi:hypothetical protein V6L76_15800 [Pannonibacter sp. Pt2]|uniref:CHAD domain-containing protein n=1 Tax=Pannonibacter anstelovis TaxID=3121537 RepID=A0ABU7ZRS6_9HYPH